MLIYCYSIQAINTGTEDFITLQEKGIEKSDNSIQYILWYCLSWQYEGIQYGKDALCDRRRKNVIVQKLWMKRIFYQDVEKLLKEEAEEIISQNVDNKVRNAMIFNGSQLS